MVIIMIEAVIIILVLLYTSHIYGEIRRFIMAFVVVITLNI